MHTLTAEQPRTFRVPKGEFLVFTRNVPRLFMNHQNDEAPLLGDDEAPRYDPARDGVLRIVTWNIQFAAGSDCHFFYEGGDLTSVPSERQVFTNLDTLAERITALDADVVLLQEVDRGSRRSWYIDEHAELRQRCPAYKCDASTWYWKVPWVPTPLGVRKEQLGRVNLHLSVLSKYLLGDVQRVPLPAIISDGCLTRFFNLRRCVQRITLPAADGVDVTILNTHLSAFTSGDGTSVLQVAVLRDLIASAGPRWLLAGDFNALPPGVSAVGLTGQAAIEYPVPDAPSAVAPLFELGTSVIPLAQLTEPQTRASHFTLKYHGRALPEVTIDYIFAAPGWALDTARVAREVGWPSDHLPLVASLRPP